MTVILEGKLFYAAVPKVACTAIKRMFFKEENNGRDFMPIIINGKSYHIHEFYKTIEFRYIPINRISDCIKITIVRDPVNRFLSAFSNRVVYHSELSVEKAGKKLKELSLEPDPPLDLFIEKYDLYSKASPSIFHHTRPLVDYLGPRHQFFDRVFDISQINLFVEHVSERLGKEICLTKQQTGGPKFSADDLSQAQLESLRKVYAEDYNAYGKFFS